MTEVKKNPTLVIDGMSLFMSVAGPAIHLTNGFTYSFFTQLTAAVKKFKPSGIIVCWEGGGYGKRKEVWADYKHTRTPMDETRKEYRNQVQQMLKHLGIDQMRADGYEADDLGAFLSNTLDDVILFSNDHDWLQLVKPNVSIYQKVRVSAKSKDGRGKFTKTLITHENFHELLEWASPDEFVKSLMVLGDKDECPGIVGVGGVTLRKYFEQRLPENSAYKTRLDEFFAGGELYDDYKALVDIREITKLPQISIDPGEYDERAVKALLEELQFASILKYFHDWVGHYKEAVA